MAQAKKNAKKKSAKKTIDLDFYFSWSGTAPCSVRYLYVNGKKIVGAPSSPAKGPVRARVVKRPKYLVEWGLEFQGATRRKLKLRVDIGATGSTKQVSTSKKRKHFWVGAKKT